MTSETKERRSIDEIREAATWDRTREERVRLQDLLDGLNAQGLRQDILEYTTHEASAPTAEGYVIYNAKNLARRMYHSSQPSAVSRVRNAINALVKSHSDRVSVHWDGSPKEYKFATEEAAAEWAERKAKIKDNFLRAEAMQEALGVYEYFVRTDATRINISVDEFVRLLSNVANGQSESINKEYMVRLEALRERDKDEE